VPLQRDTKKPAQKRTKAKKIDIKRFKNLDLFSFLEFFNHSILPYPMLKNPWGGLVLDTEEYFYLFNTKKKIAKKYKEEILSEYDTPFRRWQEKFVKTNIKTVELPVEWGELPWKEFSAPEKLHIWRGNYLHGTIAEKYDKVLKYFSWKDYILIASPDGITDEFCYEFKSVSSKNMSYYMKHVAINQAMLYSYFFKRPYYRVQMYIQDIDETVTIQKKVNTKKAEEILINMDKLLKGKIKPVPPKQFKCNVCSYKKKCTIS